MKYVLAVSGGVDSVVLLDKLVAEQQAELVVAHFDHGIRPDSAEDSALVERLALQHGLPFYAAQGQLGPDASEAVARKARYDFLESVRLKTESNALVTAHHQDDVLETAIINMMRGTGRRGLSSLRETATIKRPLLHLTKSEIVNYAQERQLIWREDSTNADDKYVRNHIRHNVLPKFSAADKKHLLYIINDMHTLNDELDATLESLLPQTTNCFERALVRDLPDAIAREVLATWLRQKGIPFDRKSLERTVLAVKLQRNGSSVPLKRNNYLQIGRDEVTLTRV